ncbi:Ribonuclease M5, partial [Bienertia sinuspersici]
TFDGGKKVWKLYTDGSTTINGSGADVSNNKAKYEAAITLVANKVCGEYKEKRSFKISYLDKVKELTSKLRGFEVELIPRNQTKQADTLSKLTSSTLSKLNKFVYLEAHHLRNIDLGPTTHDIISVPSLVDPIMAYKLTGEHPEDKNEASELKRIASGFIILHGELLRKLISKHYNMRVNARLLRVGDLVVRNQAAIPYEIFVELHPGIYKLRQIDGTELKNY